jgi:hypothetical protein
MSRADARAPAILLILLDLSTEAGGAGRSRAEPGGADLGREQ